MQVFFILCYNLIIKIINTNDKDFIKKVLDKGKRSNIIDDEIYDKLRENF